MAPFSTDHEGAAVPAAAASCLKVSRISPEGIDLEANVTPQRETNVVDLMTVLKQSLGQTPGQDVARQPEKKRAKPPMPKRVAAAQAATGKSRKRA